MKRTKLNVPDFINGSPDINFTQISNEILDNGNLSFKAKGILCTLLRNKQGWSTNKQFLINKSKDGADAIESGLKELEDHGYLKRLKYRDKKTKRWVGSIWVYSHFPNEFDWNIVLDFVNERNLQIPSIRPTTGFPTSGFSTAGKSGINNTKDNNTNINSSYSSDLDNTRNSKNGYITPSKFDIFWKLYPKKVDKGKSKTKWNQLCKRKQDRPTWKEIKLAIYKQQKSERWQDPKFIPHPTTWLNQSRWLDDPNEMKVIYRNEFNKSGTLQYGRSVDFGEPDIHLPSYKQKQNQN